MTNLRLLAVQLALALLALCVQLVLASLALHTHHVSEVLNRFGIRFSHSVKKDLQIRTFTAGKCQSFIRLFSLMVLLACNTHGRVSWTTTQEVSRDLRLECLRCVDLQKPLIKLSKNTKLCIYWNHSLTFLHLGENKKRKTKNESEILMRVRVRMRAHVSPPPGQVGI